MQFDLPEALHNLDFDGGYFQAADVEGRSNLPHGHILSTILVSHLLAQTCILSSPPRFVGSNGAHDYTDPDDLLPKLARCPIHHPCSAHACDAVTMQTGIFTPGW